MAYLFVAVEVALTWRDSDSVIGIGKVETLGGVEPWKMFQLIFLCILSSVGPVSFLETICTFYSST